MTCPRTPIPPAVSAAAVDAAAAAVPASRARTLFPAAAPTSGGRAYGPASSQAGGAEGATSTIRTALTAPTPHHRVRRRTPGVGNRAVTGRKKA
jgi:hypothetical protein